MQTEDNISHTFTQTTNNSSIKNKKIKPMRCSFNIQSTSQLINCLMNENIYLTKNILIFLITALRHYHRNLIFFYEILKNLLEKLNNNNIYNNKSFVNEKTNSFFINLLINENNKEIIFINKYFDNIFSFENIENLLYSNNKHKINVLLFSFMVTFTYHSEEIEKINCPKKDIFKLLEFLKDKYLCSLETNKLCDCCSLSCIIKVYEYLNKFNNEKKNTFINIYMKEKKEEEEKKHIEKLYYKLYDVEKNIKNFENYILKNKTFSNYIQKELKQIDLKYEKMNIKK